MPFEGQISELIPDGRGEVLWLGPQHAQSLIDGLQLGEIPPRAIVLQSLLGRFENPGYVLRQVRPVLGEDGVLVALVAPRLSPLSNGGFTRRELLALFAQAGYEVASCTAIHDPRLPLPALTLAGAPGARPADEVEEAASVAILLSARIPVPDAPEFSIVTTSDADLPVPPGVEVIPARGPNRATAWNTGARKATGRWVAFLDAGDAPHPGWLEKLAATLQSSPRVGAAGTQALAFSSDPLPTHQLPSRIMPAASGVVDAVEGGGMLLQRSIFVAAGGFDPELGPRYDGPDLCLRLRSRGFQIRHSPEAEVESMEPETTTRGGVRYFLLKWRGQIPPAESGVSARRPRTRRRSATPVLWSAPLLQRSGYGEEARSFVLALDHRGISVRGNPTDWQAETRLQHEVSRRLSALLVTEVPERFVNVVHSFPAARMMIAGSRGAYPMIQHFKPHPRAVRNIGRTMYETDSIPDHWVAACNEMDEIWVPAAFNVETFARAGVAREKLFRIPGAIDADRFDRDVVPARLPGAEGFVFLSVFAWSLRKGWDVLVRAFMEEFDRGEDVTLALKVLPHWNRTLQQHQAELSAYVRDVLGRDLRGKPRVIVLARDMGVDEMPGLYRAANAFVLPSRGEGYGRPYLEAMVSGLPVIATRWGGCLDFLNDDNSYLVDCSVVDVSAAGIRDTPDYSGHRWAEPDVESLRRAMRAVFEDREEAARRAARGRTTALENHTWEPVADAILARLEAGGVSPLRARLPDSLPVTWEGPNRTAFGIAEVNREIGSALDRIPAVDVRRSEAATMQPWLWGRPPEVTVRHQWPPDFQPPVAGRLITYQPWEFGSLPSAWIEPMNRQMAEVWVPTTYVRDCFIRSGVDPGKLAIVPYGIDPSRFDPEAPPMRLPTKKKHRFLFVGGTIPRKGADILLETYLATFTPRDDVCLVIKDLGAATFYRDQGLGERIKAAQADAASAEVVYIDTDLSAGEMPGLYTACQCLVHPYRGEGFGLPIAEAMACGLAVIVPRHGACLDFCDESVAYLVDAREVRLPEPRIGSIPTVELPWWGEIDRVGLSAAMKRVVNKPAEAKAVGLRASARIRSQWTWDRAADIAAARLLDVAERPPRLTACVTARGSARGLARCLEYLDGFADEIVVVVRDLGGKAAKVAQDHGAKVAQFSGPETPGAARNEGLRRATGDWVLVMEPDEWLDERGRLEVQGLIRLEGRAAYLALTTSGGRDHVGTAERLRVRLFPNHPSLRFSGGRGEALVDGSGAVIAGQETGLVIHVGQPS